MKKMIYLAAAMSLLLMCPAGIKTQEVGTITIRLSYKVVLNPTNGTRPPGVADADINAAVAGMNDLMRDYFRGYSFQVTEIVNVGGISNPPAGPSQWYDKDFFDSTIVNGEEQGIIWKKQMEAAAIASPGTYLWRTNAINIYITNFNNKCAGICSFPSEHILIIGGCVDGSSSLQLHEIGHYFGLCHTQGCPCGDCTTCSGPGDDRVSDTLPDRQCWAQDDIAQNAFNGRRYGQLTTAERQRVDDVFFNIMSYHNNTTRLTERQLDLWSVSTNLFRVSVRTGRMIFAQSGAPAGGNGNPGFPYNTATAARNSAASDVTPDIIILLPGAFNETLTINTPVTLRATREGAAAIGSSRLPVAAASSEERPILQPKPTTGASHSNKPRLGFAGSGNKTP